MALSADEKSLCAVIEKKRDALLEDLRRQVALPTGGGNTSALDELRGRLVERAEALGAKTTLVPGEPRPEWLFDSRTGKPEGEAKGDQAPAPPPTAVCRRELPALKPILLAGHLDTVHDPRGRFQELVVDDAGTRATGPGCVDMKGGLVITLAALEALEEAGVKLSWTLLLNSDEETGSYHSFNVIKAEAERVAGFGGVGIAVEPATETGALVIARGGAGQFVIEATGKAAHVGRNFGDGASAVVALAERIMAAAGFTDLARGQIVNIGPLQGGLASNVVPDLARAWGNVRFVNEDDAKSLEAEFVKLATEKGAIPGVEVRTSFNRPAKPMTSEVEKFAVLVREAAEDLSQKLPFANTAGVCDGNIMQSAGLATLDTLGVRGGGLHTPQEWIELDSLTERCQLLGITMMRVGGKVES